MTELGTRIIYKQLLQHHGCVRIPLIQRDYAQGRPAEEEIREQFLRAIEFALMLPSEDDSLPLNLDFIYGSVIPGPQSSFLPLDGQQRLTTLFLLHWYLAWRDEKWQTFEEIFCANEQSRFSYSVRPSSNEFFNALVNYHPKVQPEEIPQLSQLVSDQRWYFRSWRLDPTIQSALVMLDAIHGRFRSSVGLFDRLVDEAKPAITFQLLDLEHFGLSDDLYIKMNARGKALTAFETFKARYEQELGKQFGGETRSIDGLEFSLAEFVSRRMDTTWSELFWQHRDKHTNLYDEAIMNLFRAVALVTRDPASDTYTTDIGLLRNRWDPPSYSTFYKRGWLDRAFTVTLISLLESWSARKEFANRLLPDQRYFDEKHVLEHIFQDSTSLTWPEVTQFCGYALYVTAHEGSIDPQPFQEWMRVVHNLAVNSFIERAEELRGSARGLRDLLPRAEEILQYVSEGGFKGGITGFNEQQIKEESLKASLIVSHSGWRPLIDRAEGHSYFNGQIEFLLDFSGVVATNAEREVAAWEEGRHADLQSRFEDYLTKAERMFGAQGLNKLPEYRWERALLAFGDYLLPSGPNYSFVVNSSTEPHSWKRLLRGSGERASASRRILQHLWDVLSTSAPFDNQLQEVISRSKVEEQWREALIRTPAAIEYCRNRCIRFITLRRIYLLAKSQMNGAHAELFTFCLHHQVLAPMAEQGKLKFLKVQEYFSVNSADLEPSAFLTFTLGKAEGSIHVEFQNGAFAFTIYPREALDLTWAADLGFVVHPTFASKSVSVTEVESTLTAIAEAVRHKQNSDSQADNA